MNVLSRLEVDTRQGVFKVTPKRLKKIKNMAKGMAACSKRNRRLIPVRKLASLVGLAQSVNLAVPPARFYLRELHNIIASRKSWSSMERLTTQAYKDLSWWAHLPLKWNGRQIWRSPDSALLHSDSSEYAWGGLNVTNGLVSSKVGQWVYV